jgi:N-acetyl-anhydromuramyl-L-alanine amidase AmpD
MNNVGPAQHAAHTEVVISSRPIIFDERRRELSVQYLRDRHGLIQANATIVPKIVVVHWTNIPTADETFAVFDPVELPSARHAIGSASALNVSSQYLVDRDGTIFQLLPDTLFARHVIGLNYCAIGIENVGNGSDLPLTDAQLEANIALIRQLHGEHDIEYLIGHYEYSQFVGHRLWREADPDYLTQKTDPGIDFMSKLRTRLDDLHLAGAPGREKATGAHLIDERGSAN